MKYALMLSILLSSTGVFATVTECEPSALMSKLTSIRAEIRYLNDASDSLEVAWATNRIDSNTFTSQFEFLSRRRITFREERMRLIGKCH